MQVRKLQNSEYFEGERIAMIAFHGTMASEEEKERVRRECEASHDLQYGAFTDDGQMMGRIVNNKFTTLLDGHPVPTGGIGGVATLPEYRNDGCIRQIFQVLLADAYRDGEVLSCLYPFNISFYRKFGYEAAPFQVNYVLAPSVLQKYRFQGQAVLYHDGDPAVGEYTALYNRFARDYNAAMVRDDAYFYEHKLKGDYFKDRKFAYLLRENGENVAYLIFADDKNEIVVKDLAFLGRRGLNAILGFLARFTADYFKIRLYMPMGIELYSILQSRDIYDMTHTTRQDFMVRAVNARKVLALLRRPQGSRFVVRVMGDEQIPENNRTWLVTDEDVRETEEAPDLTVSIQALSQLAIGAADLFEAAYRNDTQVHKNEAVLKTVFVRKPIMIQNYF